MIWRVEIKDKEGIIDALGEGIFHDASDLGIVSVEKVSVSQIYLLDGDIEEAQAKKICEELLVDRIIQDYSLTISDKPTPQNQANLKTVEIAYNPGVMDPVENSTLKGIRDLGIERVKSVRTAKKYFLYGKISPSDINTITNKILCNKLIQHVKTKPAQAKSAGPKQDSFQLTLIDIARADDKKLSLLSRQGQLFLNLDEMRAIKKHFAQLKRNPTDCELETIAQTWSEHCNHKTFRGNIAYQCSENGKTKKTFIRSLLKSTIVKATEEIKKPWCVSVFHDNAGVIEFDQDSHVCFKVETHNHPSALEPFGGANTGVGGVIRDILGTGLGAKPICNTDVFCFAPPDFSFDRLPEGALHPKRIMKGVVSGVRDYGNKMGIPTINGAILFDERFAGNPLVFCGTVGIIPKNRVKKQARQGDLVVVVGGRTGRDGIHGATFSSGELTHESETVSSGAVQIGNPIEEKKVLDALMKARDKNLYSAITDCGAGGLSSAVGEMGMVLGCRVDLEKVPLKYDGLNYTEIWISESQERMVLAVPQDKKDELLKTFEDENSEATVIGEFTGTGRLELFFQGCQVCDLSMEFLHEGLPKITKKAVWAEPKLKEPRFVCPKSLTDKLREVISHPNVCSKEWVIRQYDHEVQGMSVIKPLAGITHDGPSDASIIRPKLDGHKGIAVSNGINIRFGMIDPFWMAASCIDEAVRQIIAVGGNLEKIAILDNFCWGNPDKPDRLGGLVRAAQGCYKAAKGLGVPFISGKDSLYNEYTDKGKSLAIPGTILISAIGIIDDVRKTVTMDFKKEDNLIYVIGETFAEMGGSIYFDTYQELGSKVPQPDTEKGKKVFRALYAAIQKGLVSAVHDCSEGGIGVAVSEMAFSGGLGATIFLKEVPYKIKKQEARSKETERSDFVLFSESNSRFIVEVSKEAQKDFEAALKGIAFGLIGCVNEKKVLTVYGLDNEVCVKVDTGFLKESWQKTLRW